jgi:mannosyltransferase OCH1-like enzyme
MIIPKKAHQIWLGGDPIPEEFKYYTSTFKKLHPNWEYILWTEKNIPVESFVNKELYKKIKEVVVKTDIARFELLRLYGGIYADQDMEFYKNIEPLLKDVDIFSCGEREGIIGNAILGSVPNHPTLTKVLKTVPKSVEENKPYGGNIKTGPVFLTRLLDYKKDLTVLRTGYFFPTPAGMPSERGLAHKYPNAFGNHHWAASWVGLDKEEKVTGYIPKDYLEIEKKNREKNISFIIPYKPDNGPRDKIFNFVYNKYKKDFPNSEFIFGEDTSGEEHFCKSHAVNDGVAKSKGEIIIITDGDLIVDKKVIEKGIAGLRTSPFILPFGYCANLTAKISEEIVNGQKFMEPQMRQNNYVVRNIRVGESQWGDKLAGLIQIITKDLFYQIGGMDERFKGWGYEDTVFCWRIMKEIGDYDILPNDWIYHLHHEQNNPFNEANYELAQKIKKEWKIDELIESFHRKPIPKPQPVIRKPKRPRRRRR